MNQYTTADDRLERKVTVMTARRRFKIVLSLLAVGLMTLVIHASAKEIPEHLPESGNEEVDTSQPVQVYILAGQSNMVGMGEISGDRPGTLETITEGGKFPHLVDDNGDWTARKDVYYVEARLNNPYVAGPLTVPPHPGKSTIGPEVQFGHIMGYYHKAQVLVIKTAQGNRALGWDFRPPSSGFLPDIEDDLRKWEGREYRLMVDRVRRTLVHIEDILPNYQGQGYEIAGFVWWQGHRDGGKKKRTENYEKHLVNLINDIRDEFDVPGLPVAIATVGFGGHDMEGNYLKILKAQMAVSDPDKHPELAENVFSVDIRDFWRSAEESPKRQGYHYNRNAETFMLVGDALGRGMVQLLEAGG